MEIGWPSYLHVLDLDSGGLARLRSGLKVEWVAHLDELDVAVGSSEARCPDSVAAMFAPVAICAERSVAHGIQPLSVAPNGIAGVRWSIVDVDIRDLLFLAPL